MGLIWNTNMAAVSLFWDTNMVYIKMVEFFLVYFLVQEYNSY